MRRESDADGSSASQVLPESPYAAAVLNALLDAELPVDLVVSRAARLTILDETGISWRDAPWKDEWRRGYGRDTIGDLVSGHRVTLRPSVQWSIHARDGGRAASTAAVAGIAIGLSKDLLQRAADVTVKERRTLVLVPR